MKKFLYPSLIFLPWVLAVIFDKVNLAISNSFLESWDAYIKIFLLIISSVAAVLTAMQIEKYKISYKYVWNIGLVLLVSWNIFWIWFLYKARHGIGF